MKTTHITFQFSLRLITACILFISMFTACQEDENNEDATYFSIESNPTSLKVEASAKKQSYTVRSNRPWQLVEQEEADWIRALPAEGKEDGIFTLEVDANHSFETRSVNFAILVDGLQQSVFPVEQAASVPYVAIQDADKGLTVLADGGQITVNISANTEWEYVLEQVDWLSIMSVTNSQIILSAEVNQNAARTTILTITAINFPEVSQSITLTQAPGSVLLDENFSWLSYGSAIFYTTTGETRYDNWTSAEQNQGWTSTVNTTEGSGNTPLVYARQGFAKLGKTGYGGDLITPDLNFDGTQTLKVTFKAVPYMTAAGTQDDNILNISLIGPGILSQDAFTIDNWPDYATDPECTAIWADPVTERTFTIFGATSNTQIKFLGGDYYLKGVGKGKNRIFLDDIKIEIIE
ncbi:BACON domain-containing protein [Gaoshiqia sediminis]|uniref:BACON domain-containing protein n=1 Tax=Gaoshiqia sediminis TaxID=2986998 RepID=A0AA41YBA5_9BACT|nr:BACON domain-containing protein [Gaoshiqia sediminis]MCW0482830.1 BACON domain-containing protein [Gaoshiqia sediminis]